jgi:hypothetical protein
MEIKQKKMWSATFALVLVSGCCCDEKKAEPKAEGGGEAPKSLLGEDSDWGPKIGASAEPELNMADVGTRLLFSVVPIDVVEEAGKGKRGTGFIFLYEEGGKQYPALVTNRHLVKSAMAGVFYLVEEKDGQPVRSQPLAIPFKKEDFRYDDPGPDLAVYPIGAVYNQMVSQKRTPFIRALSKELFLDPKSSATSAIEEVIFIGYPAGIVDKAHLSPLVRRGTTATHPLLNFEGRPAFLIDAGVFEGSSGSPVFIYNPLVHKVKGDVVGVGSRLLFVGVIKSTVRSRLTEKDKAAGMDWYIDLGVVINSNAVAQFVEKQMRAVVAEEKTRPTQPLAKTGQKEGAEKEKLRLDLSLPIP